MAMRIVLWLAAGMIAAMPFAGAQAAPQILAALPSDAGIPFTCSDAGCKADISTYCLMRNRPAPGLGAVYVPARPDQFTLVVTDAGGHERALPAGEHVKFVENRGFMSISAAIAEADLKRLGATRAVIRIVGHASLVPVPVAGDPDPLTEKEIAYATDSLRAEGAEIVEGRPEAATARMLAAVANRLPPTQEFDTGEFESLWNELIESIPAGSPERGAIGDVRVRVDGCVGDVRDLRFSTVRRCLEWRHDKLIRELNVDYWDSQIGS